MDIKDIEKYYEFRAAVMPSGKEALDFLVTEVGEAFDAFIRQTGKNWVRKTWVRNKPEKDSKLGAELGDIYQMLQIAAHQLEGCPVETLLARKWQANGFSLPTITTVSFVSLSVLVTDRATSWFYSAFSSDCSFSFGDMTLVSLESFLEELDKLGGKIESLKTGEENTYLDDISYIRQNAEQSGAQYINLKG